MLNDTRSTDRLRVSQGNSHGQGRLWPQQLELLLSYDDRNVRVPLSLTGAGASLDWAGRTRPNFVLPNASGIEYGHFRLDPESVVYLMANLPDLENPLTRGIAWVTLWDGMLEGEIAPTDWFELLLRGLESETVEQNTQRILEYLGKTFWAFLDNDRRRENAPHVESALWSALADAATPTLRAAYFRTWRRIVLSDAGLERMRRIWEEQEDVPGVPLSEPDFTALAEELAVRAVAGADEILTQQVERIENPDRLARFTFVRPALSTDPRIREVFFDGLRDPANREREPWVLAAVGYLHHPLRATHARRFILPSLELVEEIQRTGDIFFPARWLGATLGGHRDAAAAHTVRGFLDGLGPDYPHRLREKILQSADMLFRSARIAEQ
jgi:aminopeptidase N